MSKGYEIGYKVEVEHATQALNSYGQSLGYIIDAGTMAEVTGYSDKGNYKIEDDFAKIKIVSGDPELTGKEVWIRSADFKNVIKTY